MARWASQAVIGSADFSGCRVELIDAGGFKSNRIGSVDFANDGTPIVQTVERDKRGVRFGLKMVSALGTSLTSLFNSIATAEATGLAIRGQITDGIFTLDIWVVPDYSQQEWFTFSKHSEGWYEDVALRFISKGDYS